MILSCTSSLFFCSSIVSFITLQRWMLNIRESGLPVGDDIFDSGANVPYFQSGCNVPCGREDALGAEKTIVKTVDDCRGRQK